MKSRPVWPWIDAALILPHAASRQPPTKEALAGLHGRATGSRGSAWRRVFCVCLRAELYADAGHPDEGRRILAEVTPADRQAFCGSEISRLEGDLPWQAARPAVEDAARALLDELPAPSPRSHGAG